LRWFEVYDLAHDFGWLVVENISKEIREIQAETTLARAERIRGE
jgi:hypothetical protein